MYPREDEVGCATSQHQVSWLFLSSEDTLFFGGFGDSKGTDGQSTASQLLWQK